ncbi:MAG: sugar ABC transporter permease [Propionibacteriaceae bacterium]|nr:sugar ABC transporter permease [Propionibacteriaceae bacterium]
MSEVVAEAALVEGKTQAGVRYRAKDKTPRSRRSKLRLRNTLLGWSFIAPNFIGFALLTLLPILALFYVSFTDWNAFGQANWIGLDNFRRLFTKEPNFEIALKNTLYYTVLHVPLTMAASLGLAILLNRKLKGVTFFRTAAFFPYICSIVAVAVVWNALFHPEYGPINEVLRFIGIDDPPRWTVSKEWAMPAVVIVGTWREMGYYMLLYLAGLQTIPREQYEAASLDGASSWQQFLYVTWPGLRPQTFFIAVMLTIGSMKVFDLVLVMTDGGPGTATLVLSQLIWNKSFKETGQFGYASSIAVVLFVICLVFTLVQFFVNKRNQK